MLSNFTFVLGWTLKPLDKNCQIIGITFHLFIAILCAKMLGVTGPKEKDVKIYLDMLLTRKVLYLGIVTYNTIFYIAYIFAVINTYCILFDILFGISLT